MNLEPSPHCRTHDTAKLQAFTRVELLGVFAVLALLTLLVLPALANNHPRSQRVICANNLRQIGAGMQLWGNDHNDLFPQEVPVAEGGTRLHPLASNVWLHFAWISNELGSAKVFFCLMSPSTVSPTCWLVTATSARTVWRLARDSALH